MRSNRDKSLRLKVSAWTREWQSIRSVMFNAFVIYLPLLCSQQATGSDYYKTQILAEAGQDGINSISGSPSINDHGQVAFAALVQGGESVYVADGMTVVNITSSFISANRAFSTYLQINNESKVGARDRVSGAPPLFLQRRWDSRMRNAQEVLERTSGAGYCNGGLRAGQTCVNNSDCPPDILAGSFGFCVRGSGYDSLVFSTINNNGRMAFMGLRGNSNFLVSATSAIDAVSRQVSFAFRPMIADNGAIIGREGSGATSPIRLYRPNLSGYDDIANTQDFSELGLNPGISDDGQLVAFTANRHGRGVFISFLDDSGTRRTLNIAGENATPKSELGQIDPNTPLYFSQFEMDSRVAVITTQAGNPGIDGNEVLVSFIATPNQAASGVAVGSQRLSFLASRGIWTIRGTLRQAGGNRVMFERSRVLPVIQAGETLDPEGTVTVDGFSTHDPLAKTSVDQNSLKNHQVAFSASSGSRQFVVRALACACEEPTLSPQPSDITVNPTEAHGWSMTIHVSDDDGLVLRNVRLGDRYLAPQISVPYFKVKTSVFSNQGAPVRCELRPNDVVGPARSRLLELVYGLDANSSDPGRAYVIEARYAVDQVGQSCLEIVQKYLFFPLREDDPVELSGFFKAQRFFPLITYNFCPKANETLESIEFAQRMHFQVDGIAQNNSAFLKDTLVPEIVDYFPFFDVGTVGVNPQPKEFSEQVIVDGHDMNHSDSIHQTFNKDVDEPVPSGIRPAGCPECVHMHWGWAPLYDGIIYALNVLGVSSTPGYSRSGFLRYPFKTIPFDGEPIIPTKARGFSYDSSQSVYVAAAIASSGEEDAEDFTVAVNQQRALVSSDQAFWYVSRSDRDEETFGIHGGFFGPTLFGAHVTPLFEVNRNASFVGANGGQEATLSFQNISQSTVEGPIYVLLKGEEAFNLENADGYEVVRWPRNLLLNLATSLSSTLQAIIVATENLTEKPPYAELVSTGDRITPGSIRSKIFRFKTLPRDFPQSADSFKIYAGKVTGLPFNPSAFLPTVLLRRSAPQAPSGRAANPVFGYELTVTGPAGFTYFPTGSVLRVDVSTNLIDWQIFRQISPTNTVITFTDPVATSAPSRFYRVTWEALP